MRVWVVCFIALFGLAELFQWLKQFSLPLPVFILGGAFLAIASNYDKLTDLPFHPDYEDFDREDAKLKDARLSESAAPPISQVTPTDPSDRARNRSSISFEIHKPFQPIDQERI